MELQHIKSQSKSGSENIFSQGTYTVDDSFQQLPLINGRPYGKYYKWGETNRYPLWIANVAQLFPAESIINGTIDMIAAALPEEVDKDLIRDYVIFGNAFTNADMERIPAMSVRIGIEGGIFTDPVHYFTLTGKMKFIKTYKHLRFDNTPYAYSAPYWHGVIKDLLVIARATNFAYNVFDNEFGASGILTITNAAGKTKEEKQRIKRKTEEYFTGSGNAGKYLIGFSESAEDSVKFERIDADMNLTRKYDSMSATSRENVYAGFRCYPQLFGIKLQDSFINNEDYAQMLDTYDMLVVQPIAEIIANFLGIKRETNVEETQSAGMERIKLSLYEKLLRYIKSDR